MKTLKRKVKMSVQKYTTPLFLSVSPTPEEEELLRMWLAEIKAREEGKPNPERSGNIIEQYILK